MDRFLFYVTNKNIKMIAFNSFEYLSRFCGTSSALENAFMLSNNRKFIRFQKTYVSMNVLQIHGNKTISNVIVLRMGSIETKPLMKKSHSYSKHILLPFNLKYALRHDMISIHIFSNLRLFLDLKI